MISTVQPTRNLIFPMRRKMGMGGSNYCVKVDPNNSANCINQDGYSMSALNTWGAGVVPPTVNAGSVAPANANTNVTTNPVASTQKTAQAGTQSQQSGQAAGTASAAGVTAAIPATFGFSLTNSDGTPNWLIIGALGLGAVALVMMMSKK